MESAAVGRDASICLGSILDVGLRGEVVAGGEEMLLERDKALVRFRLRN